MNDNYNCRFGEITQKLSIIIICLLLQTSCTTIPKDANSQNRDGPNQIEVASSKQGLETKNQELYNKTSKKLQKGSFVPCSKEAIEFATACTGSEDVMLFCGAVIFAKLGLCSVSNLLDGALDWK